jgi:hypothetical protein
VIPSVFDEDLVGARSSDDHPGHVDPAHVAFQ